MNTRTSRRLSAFFPLVLVAAAGCGVSAATEPVSTIDPAQARQALRAALDAWKGGASPDAVAGVRVADDDWLAGAKLVDYRLTADGDALGPSLRAPVTLTLRNKKGRTVRRAVAYDVTAGPAASVIRHE